MKKKYVLTEKQLFNLLVCQLELSLLDNYGVDNWSGYGMWYDDNPALDLYEEACKALAEYTCLD